MTQGWREGYKSGYMQAIIDHKYPELKVETTVAADVPLSAPFVACHECGNDYAAGYCPHEASN